MVKGRCNNRKEIKLKKRCTKVKIKQVFVFVQQTKFNYTLNQTKTKYTHFKLLDLQNS